MTDLTPAVSRIVIHPVKSLRGLPVAAAPVEDRGLRHDRRWALVNEDGRCLTQRAFPRMALIGQSISSNGLHFIAPDTGPLSVPLEPPPSVCGTDIRVGGSVCQALPVGRDADIWFSAFLGTACRLVYMPEAERRTVGEDFVAGKGIVSLADCYPLLLMAEASLADLNRRLETPVPMDRFRPNLVVTGSDAFAEDRWGMIRIGGALFQLGKGCARCVLTTVDQATGERQGPEPLRTLASYRLWDQEVLFGQFLIPLELGKVRIGDAVEVLEARGQQGR